MFKIFLCLEHVLLFSSSVIWSCGFEGQSRKQTVHLFLSMSYKFCTNVKCCTKKHLLCWINWDPTSKLNPAPLTQHPGISPSPPMPLALHWPQTCSNYSGMVCPSTHHPKFKYPQLPWCSRDWLRLTNALLNRKQGQRRMNSMCAVDRGVIYYPWYPHYLPGTTSFAACHVAS